MKKYKFSLVLATMVLVIGLCSAGVIAFSHWHTEGSVNKFNGTEFGSELFKDCNYSTAAAKALCAEFNLDYDTLTYEDYVKNKDYVNYFSASYLKLERGKDVLLSEYDVTPEEEINSLESSCNDVYAFNGAKEIIEDICKRDGIDVTIGIIDDLSMEQIQEIETKCYNTSDHPKD